MQVLAVIEKLFFNFTSRYGTNTGTYLMFSTRTVIYLEYEGTTFSEWDVPSFCIVEDARAPSTKLLCPVPGSHRIQPLLSVPSVEDEERYLSIKADVNCFSWYIYQDENRSWDSGPTQLIKVWLYDPESASKKEKEQTARSPPLYSRTLSRQFWNLGQAPSITTSFSEIEIFSKSFDNGIWTFEVPSQTNDNMATIVGKVVTFQDCFVQDTPFTIAQPKYILGPKTGISVTLPADSEPIIEWCACYPRTAIIVTVDGIFHTSNGFLNVVEIKFPPSLIPSTMIHKVKKIGAVFPNIYILIENSLYLASIGQVINIGELYVPHVDIIGIETPTWCSGTYPFSEGELSEIILWSQDEIFLGYLDNKFHSLITASLLREKLKLPRTVDLLIVKACFDSLSASIAILLECTGCISKKILYLATYKEDTAEWNLKDFTLDLPTVGDINMEVILSALTSMVLWDDDTVFYTYKQHTQYGYFQDAVTKSKFSAVSKGSTIHQILIDYIGNAIIKLKNNALFFFKFEVTDIVKLTAWENSLKKFIFFFNPSGDLYLLTVNGTNVTHQVYPMKLEVLSAASKLNDICPYISFENNLDLNIHYVDMGDKVTFWGQIVFLENKGLSIDVEIYRPELLKTKDVINYEIARGICTKNKVHCLNTAQTWNEMIKLYNKSIETIEDVDEIWGPHNYKSCFKKRSEQLRKLDKAYEILNSSGLNFLTWPQYTSTYMFKLIILDPNFSFCNLSTYFAVQTYGIIESYFRYVKIFRAFPFVDPLMSLRPAVTAEKSNDQEKKD
uniref:Catsper channel auxiliary subunit epsilon n=1 Tax=Naja naja TaxID=35670 RepID=A0A8C6V8T0_NAJNA